MEKLTLWLYTIFTKTTLALLGFLDTREIYWLQLLACSCGAKIMDYYT
jgi:hypothetical protein